MQYPVFGAADQLRPARETMNAPSPLIVRILAALVLAWLAVSPARAGEAPLVMGLGSADSREAVLNTWGPILEDLSARLGRRVDPLVLDDYAGVIWYLASGKAQLAWLGNKAAIEAVDRAGAEIVAQSMTRYGAGYYAHLIARRDGPYADAQDVLDHAGEIEFGIGDPNSTSGFTVPSYYLFASRGIDPERIFKRLVHHNHEENFLAVAEGRLDVATGNSSAMARYKVRFPEESAGVKIIWTSPLIPSDPILVRSELNPGLKKRITDFFVEYARPGKDKSEARVKCEAENLAARKWTGFKRSDNTQLEPVRRLELYKDRLRIEADETLTDAERKARLGEVDAALKGLDRE